MGGQGSKWFYCTPMRKTDSGCVSVGWLKLELGDDRMAVYLSATLKWNHLYKIGCKDDKSCNSLGSLWRQPMSNTMMTVHWCSLGSRKYGVATCSTPSWIHRTRAHSTAIYGQICTKIFLQGSNNITANHGLIKCDVVESAYSVHYLYNTTYTAVDNWLCYYKCCWICCFSKYSTKNQQTAKPSTESCTYVK